MNVTKAGYRQSKKRLIVYATSDAPPGTVTLSVTGFGPMTCNSRKNRYQLKVTTQSPPAVVEVTSSASGSDTRAVRFR